MGQVFGGETTFLDKNGDPLSGGLVYFYANGTSTFSNTWSDPGQTTVNPNPIVLDQAGRATIWGTGLYRQVVADQFGVVQWDKPTSAGDFFSSSVNVTSNLTVGGNIAATGSLTANGGATVNGGLNVASGNATFAGSGTFGSGLTVNAPAGNELGLHVVAGNVVVSSIDRPSFSANNIADVLSMGMWEASDQLQFGITDGITGTPVTTLLAMNGTGAVGDIITSGNISVGSLAGGTPHAVVIHSGGNPCFCMDNTVGGTFGVWSGSNALQFGVTDIHGTPTAPLMRLDISGSLTLPSTASINVGNGFFSGNLFPQVSMALNIGSPTAVWENVYAHNYVTVSRDVTSAPLGGGQLEVVMGIPVKTEPHIGIAADDAKVIMGAVGEEGGTSYNVLVGVLWKALQELSEKFDAYVAAHP